MEGRGEQREARGSKQLEQGPTGAKRKGEYSAY